MLRNRTILRCSACGASLKEWPEGPAYWLGMVLWCLFAYLVVWSRGVSFWPGFLIVLMLAVPWTAAEKRLWHAYWMWRHPARCEGGHGAREPEVS